MLAEIWGREKLWRSIVISKYNEDEWHFWTPRSPRPVHGVKFSVLGMSPLHVQLFSLKWLVSKQGR